MTLGRLLDQAPRPTLLLVDDLAVVDAKTPQAPDVVVHRLDDGVLATLDQRRWGCVIIAVADRSALRRAGANAPHVGRSRAVVTVLQSATTPVLTPARPEWAEPIEFDTHLTNDGAAVSRMRFESGVLVHEVVAAMARAAGSAGVTGHGGLVTGTGLDTDEKVPADVLLGSPTPAGPTTEAITDTILGRAPVVVADADVTVDEGVFSARGFNRDVDDGVAAFPSGQGGGSGRRVTETLVAGLRNAAAVRVGSGATAYDVAALAMAGVPLLSDAALPAGLGPQLTGLVAGAPQGEDRWADRLFREEHSVRLRRAAAAEHSTLARRARLAAASGVRVAGLPSVSILLATRRPEQVPFALTQIAKQSVDVEVVVAPHGFDVAPEQLREYLGDRPTVICHSPAQTRFGDVLHEATQAASGDVVLKMDDDDWYGPDVVADLLWARRTSGADLVGMAAEFVYLHQLDLTVRRRSAAERTAKGVAGGTMLIGTDYLRALGGFRSVTRFVDAQLLAAVEVAGGSIYRTQGLGYVLRRGATGHTWAPDLGYFLSRRSVAGQWRGFRPSELMEFTDAERPGRGSHV